MKRSIFNLKPVSLAMQSILYTATGLMAFNVGSISAAEEDEAEEDNKIVITGSRISRTDAETALPVTVITREQLDRTGDISVAEVLRDLPYATTGSFFGTSGNSWANVANTDLRGLGGGRTLYLVDGVRIAGAATTGAQMANANMIPMAAVEEIHILREGASSLYGSDAIGGVINIITRKDYDGANINIFRGEPSQGGAEESDVKLTFGFSGEKTSGVVSFAHTEYGGIKGGEREHLRNPAGEPFNDYAALWYSPYANWRAAEFTPANFNPNWNPGPNCPAEQIDTTQSTISDYCYSNNLEGKDYFPAYSNNSLFLNIRREINSDMSVWARANYFTNDINTESYNLWFYGTMEADNPNNPTFGTPDQQQIQVLQDLAGVAPRITKYDSTDLSFTVGYDWATEMGDFAAYASYSRNRSDISTDSYVLTDRMQEAVDSGAYNPFLPAGGPTATQAVYDEFLHTPLRVAWSEAKSYGATWTADTEIELGGGTLAYVVGAEYHDTAYSDRQDRQTNAGNVLGSFGGDSEGSRNSNAVFAEVLLPVTDELEVTLATRNDSYSLPDTSAQTSSLKVAYRPMEDLLIRASYSEGFRAPALDDLLSAPAVSYDQVYDPATCFPAIDAAIAGGSTLTRTELLQTLAECDTNQQLRVSEGNPNLKPEDSTQKSVGVVYSTDDGFSMAIDYYDIEITNQVSYIGAQSVLNLEYNNQLGPFAACYIERDNAGEITTIHACNENSDGITTTGIDFDFRYQFDLAEMGRLGFNLAGSKALEWTSKQNPVSPRYDWVGFVGTPELRYTLNTVWGYNDLTVSLAYNHVAEMRGERPDLIEFEQGDFDAFNTMDLHINYTTDYGDFRFGARNLTDEMPTLNREEIAYPGYDESNHDIAGRVVYAGYSLDF